MVAIIFNEWKINKSNKSIINNNIISIDEIINTEEEFKDTTELNNKLGNKSFVILHVNVRSMSENINKLEVFINLLNNKPAVIVCSETWTIHHIEFFHLSGYKIFYNNSKINKAAGVILFIRDDVS